MTSLRSFGSVRSANYRQGFSKVNINSPSNIRVCGDMRCTIGGRTKSYTWIM